MSIQFGLWPVEAHERYVATLRALSRDAGTLKASHLETLRAMVAAVDLVGRPRAEMEVFLTAVLAEVDVALVDDALAAPPKKPAPARKRIPAPRTNRTPASRTQPTHASQSVPVPGEAGPRSGRLIRFGGSPLGASGEAGAVAVSGRVALRADGTLWRHFDETGPLQSDLHIRAIRSSGQLSAYLTADGTVEPVVDEPGVRMVRIRLDEEVADFAVFGRTIAVVGREGTVVVCDPVASKSEPLPMGRHVGRPVRAMAYGWVSALLTDDGAVRPFSAAMADPSRRLGEICGPALTGLPPIVEITEHGVMLDKNGSVWVRGSGGNVARVRVHGALHVRGRLVLTRDGELVRVHHSGSLGPDLTRVGSADPQHVIDFCERGVDGTVLVLTDEPSPDGRTDGTLAVRRSHDSHGLTRRD